MGFFKKLGSLIYGGMMPSAMIESFKQYLESEDEYNTNIMNCYDAAYAWDKFIPFLENESAGCSQPQDDGVAISGTFDFEEWTYKYYLFNHYSRVITLVSAIPLTTQSLEDLKTILNEVNRYDRIHQVGIVSFSDESQKGLIVSRQILLTPSIGTMDDIKKCIRELKDFSSFLCEGNMPTQDYWKRYALHERSSISAESNHIKTADEVWYPKSSKESVNYSFTNYLKVLRDDEEVTEREMFGLIHEAPSIQYGSERLNYHVFRNLSIEYKFVSYKEYPYLASFIATIDLERWANSPVSQICECASNIKADKESLLDFINQWNSQIHFTLSRMVYDEQKNQIDIIMTGLFGEDGNTRTVIDVIGGLCKAIAALFTTFR